MEQVSDIESIILSQSWKRKASSYQNSPIQRSPCRSPLRTLVIGSSQKSSQNTSQCSIEDPILPVIEINDELDIVERERIKELSKLAVPYKILTEALEKVNVKTKLPALIPAFPMRKFGKIKDSKVNPKFELIKHETYSSSLRPQEVGKIKIKSGRTTSSNASKLPPLYSPKNSIA